MSPQSFKIVVLPGDGIGPEVFLETVSKLCPDFDLKLESHLFGGNAIDAVGEALPASTLKACKEADAILMGSIGGPKWGVNAPIRPEPGLLALRKALGLYANIRPANLASESLISYSPLRADIVQGVNIVVVRELIGGIYFGTRKEQGVAPDEDTAWDNMIYSVPEVERITRVAAQIALSANPPLEIHSVDKANVLASSRLWRKTVSEVLTKDYPQLKFDHHYKLNGIVLTGNLFGDMPVSFQDSLGLLPSASLAGAPSLPSKDFKPTLGLYEPIHGSAPDIAGKGIANPIGTILSGAMLLRYSLGLEKPAQAIESAVSKVLDSQELGGLGLRTKDLGGEVTTVESRG
ncbi:3-isopropylmalate dehydrogenase [Amanita rubescens]|nr:3-isopropylmalate dehydrogenase [Amanita rubescens]